MSSGGAIDTRLARIDSSSGDRRRGGDITLTAANDITTQTIYSGGGDIKLSSSGSIDTRLGLLDSRLENNSGGVISVVADRDIKTETIISAGREINLIAGETIDTTAGELDSFDFGLGGDINIRSNGNITLARLRSSGDYGGGNVEISTTSGDLLLLNSSLLTSAFKSGRGGDVNLQAESITLDRYRILTGNFIPSILAGNISIDAKESLSVRGFAPRQNTADLSSAISTASGQNSGNITINAGRVVLQDGAVITTTVGLEGNGGNLTINASESIDLMGSDRPSIFPTTIATDMFGEGRSGDLTLQTRQLRLRDGALISASAFSSNLRQGNDERPISNGGNLRINASESVEISGSSPEGFSSGFYNQAFGPGNAGDISIETENLVIRDGGRITGSARTVEQSRLFIPGLTGFFGSIPDDEIRTILNIPEGYETLKYMIDRILSTEATGNAGNIDITANSILIDDRNGISGDRGGIIGITNSSTGGNIRLNVARSLVLRENARISTTAGTEQAGGDGGNIDINTPLLVAIPREDSDITANAFAGNGGNVEITTQGIFGLDPRDIETQLSDITASSQLGTDGEVVLNTPDLDPTSGLVEFPEDVVDPDSLRDTSCTPASWQRSRFIITGRGGLPPNPREFLNLSAGMTSNEANEANEAVEIPISQSQPLVEAQGWIVNETGEVELVASVPNRTIEPSQWRSPNCGIK